MRNRLKNCPLRREAPSTITMALDLIDAAIFCDPRRAGPALARRLPSAVGGAALGLLLILALLPFRAAAQEKESQESIFQRFALSRKVPKIGQRLFEFPVALHPQTDSNAEINKNLGFNYISSGRPDNRWYLSSSLGFSKMEWVPSDPNIDLVKVRTFDWSFLVNRLSAGWLVTTFGLGIGLMDGLVKHAEPGRFSERLEPFIPVHFGLAARLGNTVQVGLKVVHFPFFRQNPVIGTTRLLVGLGFSY